MSGAIVWAAVAAFLDRFQERRARRIPPTDDDRRWFERNKRSRNGWPRLYRVRPAESGDHWVFAVGGHSPQGFISIIRRDEYRVAVVGIDEQRFGPVVNSDEYATMRMDALLADQQRNSPGIFQHDRP
jgi:hypothetical protein